MNGFRTNFEKLWFGLDLNVATVLIGQPDFQGLGAYNLQPKSTFKNILKAWEISNYRTDMSLAELLFTVAKKVAHQNVAVIQIIDISHTIIEQTLIDKAKAAFFKTFPDAVITCWSDTGNYLMASEDSIDVVQNNNDLRTELRNLRNELRGVGGGRYD